MGGMSNSSLALLYVPRVAPHAGLNWVQDTMKQCWYDISNKPMSTVLRCRLQGSANRCTAVVAMIFPGVRTLVRLNRHLWVSRSGDNDGGGVFMRLARFFARSITPFLRLWAAKQVLFDLPDFMIVSAYTLLAIVWAEAFLQVIGTAWCALPSSLSWPWSWLWPVAVVGGGVALARWCSRR